MNDPERLTRAALRQLGKHVPLPEGKHGNAYHDVVPSQQKGTSGQRRLRRQQEAERMLAEASSIESAQTTNKTETPK